MIDRERAVDRLAGCYVTIPTMFRDQDLGLDCTAVRRNVEYLLAGGMNENNATILVAGAAGDFQTMTLQERMAVAEAVVDEIQGRIPVVMGAQSTSTRETVEIARYAERIGVEYIQVSCPYYFSHTEDDFYELILEVARAAEVGLVVYNTYWTSTAVSIDLATRLAEVPAVVGLKWGTYDTGFMEFAQMVTGFSERLCVIDNQNHFAMSHMMGARGFENHICNFWPEWGVKLMQVLEAKRYEEVQQMLVRVCMPFHQLWSRIEREYTSGDGYLDKLCMELVGLDSSRNRPPTRDIRERYRDSAREMLVRMGVSGLSAT